MKKLIPSKYCSYGWFLLFITLVGMVSWGIIALLTWFVVQIFVR